MGGTFLKEKIWTQKRSVKAKDVEEPLISVNDDGASGLSQGEALGLSNFSPL